MTDPQPLPIAEPATECRSCFETVGPADQFCQKCGFPLKGSDSEQQIFMYRKGFKKADANIELGIVEKKIRSAGITLYVLAGIFLLSAFALFFFNRTTNNASGFLITNVVVSIIFLLLGFWTPQKPVAAIICGIALYILLLLKGVFIDHANLINGGLIKIIIISYLIKGLTSALEAEKIRKQHNIQWTEQISK